MEDWRLISVTLDSETQNFFGYRWNGGGRFTLRATIETDRIAGLTKREARRALASTLRFEADFVALLDAQLAGDVRNALNSSSGDTPVRIPFWPGTDDDGTNYGAAHWLKYTPGDLDGELSSLAWSTSPPSLSLGEERVPTMRGFLMSPPRTALETPGLVSLDIRWRESASIDDRLTLPSRTWTAGPSLSGTAFDVFPFTADFSGQQDAGAVIVDATRRDLGFGRETASAVFPQLGSRAPKQRFSLDSGEASKLLRFFQDKRGAVDAFWLPVWMEDARLATDVNDGDTVITLQNAASIGSKRHLFFWTCNGQLITRTVSSISGNDVTLDSTPGDLTAATTVSGVLALVRFAASQLSVSWSNPDEAEAEIDFLEVPEELAIASGETRGDTIGALDDRAFLYTVTADGTDYFWTSYEDNLTDGDTFEPRPIEHGEIVDSVLWEAARTTLDVRTWSGCPLNNFVNGTLPGRVALVIEQCDPSNIASTRETIFNGFITGGRQSGPYFKAEAENIGSLFKRKIPKTILQATDNVPLFHSLNGLTKEDWQYVARVSDITGNRVTFDLFLPSNARAFPSSLASGYFAFGLLESLTGDKRATVLHSQSFDPSGITRESISTKFDSGLNGWYSVSFGGGTTDGGSNDSGAGKFVWTVGGTNEQIRNDTAFAVSDGDRFAFCIKAKSSATSWIKPGFNLAGSPYTGDYSWFGSGAGFTTNSSFVQHLADKTFSAGNPNRQLIINVKENFAATYWLDDIGLFKLPATTSLWVDIGADPGFSVGDTVLLTPGYDGSYDTLVGKFSDGDNFRGFPQMPPTNPSLVPMKRTSTNGKK